MKGNFVAKHARKVNRAQVHVDRKKDMKKGKKTKAKHKKRLTE